MVQVASSSNLNPTLEYDFTKDIRFRIRLSLERRLFSPQVARLGMQLHSELLVQASASLTDLKVSRGCFYIATCFEVDQQV